MILAFDVDSTLTPARQPISVKMLELLLNLCSIYEVWVVTGSDEPKCRDQIKDLFNAASRVYCCSGAELWVQGRLIKSHNWSPPSDLVCDLFSALSDSGYTELTGDHLEFRTGMVNLSIPGRNATPSQRARFTAWDAKTKLRRKMVQQIHEKYPLVHATIGGKTGIDITEKGRGKHVILQDTDKPIWFWGDECGPGGNDETLANSLTRPGDRVFITNSWETTYNQLYELFNEK